MDKINIVEKNGKQLVSARELHQYLEVKKQFTNWFNQQKDWFIENQDYNQISLEVKLAQGGSTYKFDYAITLDMAKELSMMSKVAKGKEARQYFIQCEKKLTEYKPKTQAEILLENVQLLVENERRISQVEERIGQLETRTTTNHGYFTVIGYAVHKGIKIGLYQASQIGQKASRICKGNGYPIESIYDPRFGKVGMYPQSVLEECFELQCA